MVINLTQKRPSVVRFRFYRQNQENQKLGYFAARSCSDNNLGICSSGHKRDSCQKDKRRFSQYTGKDMRNTHFTSDNPAFICAAQNNFFATLFFSFVRIWKSLSLKMTLATPGMEKKWQGKLLCCQTTFFINEKLCVAFLFFQRKKWNGFLQTGTR